MARGDHVMARGYGGEVAVLRVWFETPDAVWLHDELSYQRHRDGLGALWPIGMSRRDVYWYDEALIVRLQAGANVWDRARPYQYESRTTAPAPETG